MNYIFSYVNLFVNKVYIRGGIFIKGLFITGTDTDVGKTVASTLLTGYLKQKGVKIASYKPVQSGADTLHGKLAAPDVEFYKLANPELNDKEAYTYLFKKACSPHLAAREEGIRIEQEKIIDHYKQLEAKSDLVLIEGAGGVIVPLTDAGYSMLDLMKELAVPAVVVARTGVGTINHTVLTVDKLKQEGVPVAGVVMNRLHIGDPAVELDNQWMIEKLTKVPVIGVIPYMDNPAEAIKNPSLLEKVFSKFDILEEIAIDKQSSSFR
ncbi:dethiobiotin synthase [Cytobacillus oceanisediminis]|uniref:ATP-dependent dethiobiotin synthetase BioD n=1 Tax=Cytobacillus oceanisediminis TaxID=665099 RepID=A0A562K7C9_9BACI|nr:dethiobiotin synthase [Cytobacillus oceanisediminis]TWH91312.1 dethiobiotin synthetase [Cytobacillus oceanisediminis]